MPSSYWCYGCNRFVRVWSHDSVTCPYCNGGFIEEIDTPTRTSSLSESRYPRFPSATMYPDHVPRPGIRWSQRNRGDRSPFNPVIVLRGSSNGVDGDASLGAGWFELYYDDGAGSGLRPLPASVSEFLLGSGFDRLLDQLSQMEANGIGIIDNPPASKAAIESMPTIEIIGEHIDTESHCAVCKEAFELGTEARVMPCKHLYHSDCILPWLSLRNSCPVCRHELPTYGQHSNELNGGHTNGIQNDDETIGLTIWRLPGRGFAVGRFSGGRRGAEPEFPVVYTEMDGGFNANNGGATRRISWASNGAVSRRNGGLRRIFRGVFACFGRIDSSASSSRSYSRFSSGSSSISRVFSSSSGSHRP